MSNSNAGRIEMVNMMIECGLIVPEDVVFILDYGSLPSEWTTDLWVKHGTVPSKYEHLPNAQAALKIINSPLYAALKE